MLVIAQLGIMAGVYLSVRLVRKVRSSSKTELAPATTPTALKIEAARQLKRHDSQIVVSGIAMVTTTMAYFIYPPLALVNVILLSYTIVPMLDNTGSVWQQQGRVQNDGIAALLSILCVTTGAYFSAAMHGFVYHASCRLIDQAKQTSTDLAIQAYDHQPAQIWIIQDQLEIAIDLTELQVGDVVVVKAGDVIPIDGEIASGVALIDQQALTGEAAPVEKHAGDTVLASSIVLRGEIFLEATQSGMATQAQKLNDILEQTRDYKSQLQLRGEEWANDMAIPLLISSALVIPFGGMSPAIALLFAAPLNTIRAMLALHTTAHLKWAEKHQVFIKEGRALEQLPIVDTVLFDKTGTLTETQPQVAQIVSCGEFQPNILLRYAAAAEQNLQHPIAEALRAKVAELHLDIPPSAHSNEYQMGLGVSVRIEGYRVYVGSQRYIREITGQSIPASLERLLNRHASHTFIFIAIEKRIQGAIELYPQIRPEAQALITRLKLRGISNIHVVSGDQLAPTEQVAQTLGIPHVHAEMLPQQKAELIFNLQRQGHRVCYVGDGLNDAIAMKQANVSVCLNSAADTTHQMAHVVLMEDNLLHLRDAFDVSDHLTIRLMGGLVSWIGYGMLNAVSVPLLGFGPTQSSLLYAGAWAWGYKHAMQPTWLETLRAEEEAQLGKVYEGVAEPVGETAKPSQTTPPIMGEWKPA